VQRRQKREGTKTQRRQGAKAPRRKDGCHGPATLGTRSLELGLWRSEVGGRGSSPLLSFARTETETKVESEAEPEVGTGTGARAEQAGETERRPRSHSERPRELEVEETGLGGRGTSLFWSLWRTSCTGTARGTNQHSAALVESDRVGE
jgi:hypothetical protein